LRKSPEYVPHLSLVARLGGRLVGHIMFTRLYIDGAWQSLTLAPLSVLPQYQGRGVGRLLIEEGHRLAADLGFVASVLVGHADYYPRFGYRRLSEFAFTIPFSAPPECSMVKELVDGALGRARGEAVFSAAFTG
jgi:predicted N-acetyltransferase YhbS